MFNLLIKTTGKWYKFKFSLPVEMKMHTLYEYRAQARLLKALAHETRLMILDRLNEGECSAGELTNLVAADQSTVSKHLAILRATGIVEDRRQGSNVIYSLRTPCVLSFLSCATKVFEERSEAEAEAEAEGSIRSNNQDSPESKSKLICSCQQ